MLDVESSQERFSHVPDWELLGFDSELEYEAHKQYNSKSSLVFTLSEDLETLYL